MQTIICDACHQPTPAHDVVNYGSMEGGYRKLCGRCFNGAAASRLGLQGFEHVVFDAAGCAAPDWRSTRSSCAMAARRAIGFR